MLLHINANHPHVFKQVEVANILTQLHQCVDMEPSVVVLKCVLHNSLPVLLALILTNVLLDTIVKETFALPPESDPEPPVPLTVNVSQTTVTAALVSLDNVLLLQQEEHAIQKMITVEKTQTLVTANLLILLTLLVFVPLLFLPQLLATVLLIYATLIPAASMAPVLTTELLPKEPFANLLKTALMV